jgi:putative radical SAM enzyme (TIGR03279 family)
MDLSARVTEVLAGSPGELAGVRSGDIVTTVNGKPVRDIIEWHHAVDEAHVVLGVDRGGLALEFEVEKSPGEPLGVSIASAVFDRVQTCDNHCSFCFIYQLPKGLRRSLYLKDDDYRLSFLFGNFTTLTRFTEADLERVVDQALSPLHVSIHITDPWRRADMLRNDRGAMSLRWLRVLLDHGITVRGQIVLCPGVNDGDHLAATMADVVDQFPELEAVAVVPLGLSRFNPEESLRVHSPDEARRAIALVDRYRKVAQEVLGHPMFWASDELYLLAGEAMPEASEYGDYPMYEDGVGIVSSFSEEFLGRRSSTLGPTSGFFASVDGATPSGYRAERLAPANPAGDTGLRPVAVTLGKRESDSGNTESEALGDVDKVVVLTGMYAAPVITSLINQHDSLSSVDRSRWDVLAVDNAFFGGNTAVAGLMVGDDIRRVVQQHEDIFEDTKTLYLLPDVCLSEGKFLDGTTLDQLSGRIHVVPTDGHALRRILERTLL